MTDQPKKLLREPQNIIAVGVTLISVCALVVSILQTRIMSEQRLLMHEQAKAAVWPNLSLTTHKSHAEDYGISSYKLVISNAGVGPAIVKGMRVTYKGQIAENWWDLFDKFQLGDSIETYVSNSTLNHEIIKIGEESTILDLSNNLPLAQIYFEQAHEIKIEIYYSSIYGNLWKYTFGNGSASTVEVDSVAIVKEEQFDG